MRRWLLLTAAAAAAIRGRVYPVLQESTYDDDFVHDDQAHPEQAMEMNIAQSYHRLAQASAALKALEPALERAVNASRAATHVYDAHVAETAHAQQQVAAAELALEREPDHVQGVADAKANLSLAMQQLNASDTDASAAAASIKEASLNFHSRNVQLVEARETVVAASQATAEWTAKIAESTAANASLAEWSDKLNASLAENATLAADLAAAQAALDAGRTAHKHSAVRLAEAKKLFDVDKATYEELIGPYGEQPANASLWWDALSDSEWTQDLEVQAPLRGSGPG